MEYKTLDEMLDMHIGKKGTPQREKFDADVKSEVESWKLGELIKQTRKSQHLTQKQLGERVGVGEAQISKIESGKTATFTTISRVFKALGATSANIDFGALGRVALW